MVIIGEDVIWSHRTCAGGSPSAKRYSSCSVSRI